MGSLIYEVEIHFDNNHISYIRISDNELEELQEIINDDVYADFIEFDDKFNKQTFAFNRKRVLTYMYKELEEEYK
ncbi:hypothetical protein KQI21_05230 [Virgibacillus proomii]|nr:hypothetical protein [Virgibacillus proomii]